MIDINNKSWEKLRGTDIKRLLASTDDERFFIEFKSDDESTDKLMKEISAFANTYGGYILLGINDDKSIGGCRKWTEQRIHSTIHDTITPVPNFDVRRFRIEEKTVLVIKIEEGSMPPYITNKGQIYERISSGSFPIKDSSKLNQLYSKRRDQLVEVQNKIELPPIRLDSSCPNNLCGYIDLGFNVVSSTPTRFDDSFLSFDYTPVIDYLHSIRSTFSISRVGASILITIGDCSVTNGNGASILMTSGLNNFIEILRDGSVRARIILAKNKDDDCTDITAIPYFFHVVFQQIYKLIMGDQFIKSFIYAQKYEKLTVIRQFTPNYAVAQNPKSSNAKRYKEHFSKQIQKYGGNKIVEGNRHPRNGFRTIDRRWFVDIESKYTVDNLFEALFSSVYSDLGYIEQLP